MLDNVASSSSESLAICLCSDCSVVMGEFILNPNMRLISNRYHSPSHRNYKILSARVSTMFASVLAPCLGMVGLILSGIPLWGRTLACTGLIAILSLSRRKPRQQHDSFFLEMNDGDMICYQKAGRFYVRKLQKWGWASTWGLHVACSGNSPSRLFLASAHYPPAFLRRLIRHRIYGHSIQVNQNECVQTPAKPRLWL